MSSKKTRLLENAQKNFLKGSFDRAASEYRQLIELDPSDIRHRQRLAEILTKANQKDEAIKEYNFLAKHYIDTIHYLKAIAVYKQIQKLDPANPEISLTLASLNEKQGLIGNAIAEYAAAIRIYEQNGEGLKALRTLQSMASLDPENSAIRLRIAEKYFSTGSEEKSFNEFLSLLKNLKDRDDDNGFKLISDKVVSLFGKKSDEIFSQIGSETTSDSDLSDSSLPLPEEKATTDDVLYDELEATPDFSFNKDSFVDKTDLNFHENDEIIEDILPLEEDEPVKDLVADMPENEWEEDIDISMIDSVPLPVIDIIAGNGFIEEDHSHDIELDELELELEIDLDQLAPEPENIFEAAPTTTAGDFDLVKELSIFADEIDFDLFNAVSSDSSFDINLNSGFKKNELETEDTESHYSLGLAYKEMGLFDEAVAEFICASGSKKRRIDALILQGICLKEIGNIDKAIEILANTLLDKDITEDEKLGLLYEMALCHEANGDIDLTKKLLTEIISIRPDFNDVARHLKRLKP